MTEFPKIPCKNCICLPICKNLGNTHYINEISKLESKCSILYDYIAEYDSNGHLYDRVCKWIYLNLKDLTEINREYRK